MPMLPPVFHRFPPTTRRGMLGLGIAAAATALLLPPRLAFAGADTDKRFVFIILRGGMDGVEAVVPTDDPGLKSIRGRIEMDGPLPLGSGFALNPSLKQVARLAAAREALFVHAVASPYRDRSHFDAQNVLETGGNQAFEVKDGWLNRLSASLGAGFPAIAVGDAVPAALRGPTAVANYSTRRTPPLAETVQSQVNRLWADDPLLHTLWDQAMTAQAILAGAPNVDARAAAAAASLAARFLIAPKGPRLATIEIDGFDTHTNQKYRLMDRMSELDAAIGTLAAQMGPVWNDTLVVAATEFGRTVALNGGEGTDHGTASAAFLAGGGLPGWNIKGPVIADWPGMAPASLLEGRDLKPTRDLRALLLALTARHFSRDPALLARTLFPGVEGLVPDRAFV